MLNWIWTGQKSSELNNIKQVQNKQESKEEGGSNTAKFVLRTGGEIDL